MRPAGLAPAFIAAFAVAWAQAAPARFNGFDLKDSLIPAEDVHRGGPPRDGIPALTDPRFVAAAEARLSPQDRVVGVTLGGTAKAYPIRILNWHEIVNDALAGRRIAVTYCPLCGTAMVFDAEAGGRRREFGVSGLLYNSDVLLYDRESESLWSQVMKRAVSGPAKGLALRQIPARHTTWENWRREHPASVVLSFETGHRRDYARDPYAGYDSRDEVYFPVRSDRRLPPKTWVLGIVADEDATAFVLKDCPPSFAGEVGGTKLEVRCDRRSRSAHAVDAEGNELPTVQAYWFAWAAFHPGTKIVRMRESE